MSLSELLKISGNADRKKLSKIKTSMCPRVYLILACETRRQPGEMRDPLTWTSRTTKKARANEVRHEHLRLYKSIRGKASVSIYILALTLPRVLSVRVYSWHKKRCTFMKWWGDKLHQLVFIKQLYVVNLSAVLYGKFQFLGSHLHCRVLILLIGHFLHLSYCSPSLWSCCNCVCNLSIHAKKTSLSGSLQTPDLHIRVIGLSINHHSNGLDVSFKRSFRLMATFIMNIDFLYRWVLL